MSKPKCEDGQPKGKPLSIRERLFIHHLLNEAGGNATEAARLAGYAFPAVTGCKKLRNPNIKAAIESRLETVGMDRAELLVRLTEVARLDPGDFFRIDRQGVPRLDMAKAERLGVTHLIRSIAVGRDGSVKVVFHNALDALDRLAKILGLYQTEPAARPAEPIDPRIAAALLDAAERIGGDGAAEGG